MRSVIVVILDVFIHQALEVTFVDRNHMVKRIPATVSNPSLCNTILPWTLETGSLGLDAETPYSVCHFFTEVSAAVEDQVLRCGVVWKGFAQLLAYPFAGRMSGYVEVQYSAAIMRNDEEA